MVLTTNNLKTARPPKLMGDQHRTPALSARIFISLDRGAEHCRILLGGSASWDIADTMLDAMETPDHEQVKLMATANQRISEWMDRQSYRFGVFRPVP